MNLTIAGLRKLAAEQLLQYRRNRNHLSELRKNAAAARTPGRPRPEDSTAPRHSGDPPAISPQALRQMRAWVRAIDRVRHELRNTQPQLERFMSRCFGLDVPFPKRQSVRARLLRLSMDLYIAESTAYKWRETLLDLVLFAAIEAGALSPFGLMRDEV